MTYHLQVFASWTWSCLNIGTPHCAREKIPDLFNSHPVSLARVRLTTYHATPLSHLYSGLREMTAVNCSKWPSPARSSKSYLRFTRWARRETRQRDRIRCAREINQSVAGPTCRQREQIEVVRRWRRCRFFQTRRVDDCPGPVFGDNKFIPESKCEKVCSLGDTGICFGAYLSLSKTSHWKVMVGSTKYGGTIQVSPPPNFSLMARAFVLSKC